MKHTFIDLSKSLALPLDRWYLFSISFPLINSDYHPIKIYEEIPHLKIDCKVLLTVNYIGCGILDFDVGL